MVSLDASRLAAPVAALMPSLEMAARSLKVVLITAPVHSDDEIETVITSLGREAGGGIVVMPTIFTPARGMPIISAVARNNVPTIYSGIVPPDVEIEERRC